MRILIILAILANGVQAQVSPFPMPAASKQELILEAQIRTAYAQVETMRRQFTDKYPPLMSEMKRIAALQAKLDQLRDAADRNLPERWWDNPSAAQSLSLTPDQQKSMDDVFARFRPQLVYLSQTLVWEENELKPLIATPSDETKTIAQIDRVAQARAELEKANARMLLGIRKLLAPEQWVKLNQSR